MKTADSLDVKAFRRNHPEAQFTTDKFTYKQFNALIKDSSVLIQSFINTPLRVNNAPTLRVFYYA